MLLGCAGRGPSSWLAAGGCLLAVVYLVHPLTSSRRRGRFVVICLVTLRTRARAQLLRSYRPTGYYQKNSPVFLKFLEGGVYVCVC